MGKGCQLQKMSVSKCERELAIYQRLQQMHMKCTMVSDYSSDLGASQLWFVRICQHISDGMRRSRGRNCLPHRQLYVAEGKGNLTLLHKVAFLPPPPFLTSFCKQTSHALVDKNCIQHTLHTVSYLLHTSLWGRTALVEFISIIELILTAGVRKIWDCIGRQVDMAWRGETAARC